MKRSRFLMSIDISHWSTAGGDGPSRRYFSRLQVHHRDLIFVHEIVLNKNHKLKAPRRLTIRSFSKGRISF